MIPGLVLDVRHVEADKILASRDPLAAMATVDAAKLVHLLAALERNRPRGRPVICTGGSNCIATRIAQVLVARDLGRPAGPPEYRVLRTSS